MKIMRILKSRKYGKEISQENLALLLSREGNAIIYCDLEGVAKLIGSPRKEQYFLVDECGNAVWIDPERFKVIE